MYFVVVSFPLLPRKLARLVRAFGISEAMQATHAVATVTFVLFCSSVILTGQIKRQHRIQRGDWVDPGSNSTSYSK